MSMPGACRLGSSSKQLSSARAWDSVSCSTPVTFHYVSHVIDSMAGNSLAYFGQRSHLKSLYKHVYLYRKEPAHAQQTRKQTRTPARPHIVLAVWDHNGDVQYQDLGESLRGTYDDSSMSKLDELDLTVSSLTVPEIDADDCRYLFSKTENGLQTKYCYWNDPERSIRTLESKHILGIGGSIKNVEKLKPIFLLELEAPSINWPEFVPKDTTELKTEQFIFRFFGGVSFYEGKPPLVDVMYGSGELFHGFKFRDARYNDCDRELMDWRALAQEEVKKEEARKEEARKEAVRKAEVREEVRKKEVGKAKEEAVKEEEAFQEELRKAVAFIGELRKKEVRKAEEKEEAWRKAMALPKAVRNLEEEEEFSNGDVEEGEEDSEGDEVSNGDSGEEDGEGYEVSNGDGEEYEVSNGDSEEEELSIGDSEEEHSGKRRRF
jgi:hypothetical protein